MNEKRQQRREHLKNLMRHSCDSTLYIPNSLLGNTPGDEGIIKIRKEIAEALEFLKHDNIKITITPYDDYTKIHLKPKARE